MCLSGAARPERKTIVLDSPANQAGSHTLKKSQLKVIKTFEIPLEPLRVLDVVNKRVTRNDCFYLQVF